MRFGVGEFALIAMILIVVFMSRTEGAARKGRRLAMRRQSKRRRWQWLTLALLIAAVFAVQLLLSAR